MTGNFFSQTSLQNASRWFLKGIVIDSGAGAHNAITANTGWPNGMELFGNGDSLAWANSVAPFTGIAFRATHLQIPPVDDGDAVPLAAFGTNTAVGFVFIIDGLNRCALFMLRGSFNATQELLDGSAVFSAASGTTNSTNIYYSSLNSRYEIQNNTGNNVNYSIFIFGPN